MDMLRESSILFLASKRRINSQTLLSETLTRRSNTELWLLVSEYQHSQRNTELLKHFAFSAIFLTPVSAWDRELWGESWILSIMLTRGASRNTLGMVKAHCIPHMESGLMYVRDLKCPSIVHPSGVWKAYLHVQECCLWVQSKSRHALQIHQHSKCIALVILGSVISSMVTIKVIFSIHITFIHNLKNLTCGLAKMTVLSLEK